MIILDNFSGLGKTAIITSDDIKSWDSRLYYSRLAISQVDDVVKVLLRVDCIVIITSLPLVSLPRKIRDLLGDQVVPRAKVWRFRVKRD